ncbi:hypothetical protein [Isosphaera pallida]|uniref:hypothetical protein n=1 Tax=Isosphaera pallida TaxID=128 RepID=UPI000300390B|nr:hypothetical protein [Isosphaera pallida]
MYSFPVGSNRLGFESSTRSPCACGVVLVLAVAVDPRFEVRASWSDHTRQPAPRCPAEPLRQRRGSSPRPDPAKQASAARRRRQAVQGS